MVISNKILQWYYNNKRDLPWRKTNNPYFIWLSEIILQQTRIEQGLPYYLKFIKNYPDVQSLASADEEQIMKLWQGLGYYSRAHNLQTAAKQIVERHQGFFPSTYAEIRALKGVGDYTAAAVASIAFCLPYPVVDGNVIRFISRLNGIRENTDLPSTRDRIKMLAGDLLQGNPPGDFNQAMMELGAIICKPVGPQCDKCVVSVHCMARKLNLIHEIPSRKRRNNLKTRYFHYGLFSFEMNSRKMIYIKKRGNRDIWRGLFDFPLVETTDPASDVRFFNFTGENQINKSNVILESSYGPYDHLLTHQHLRIWFHCFELSLSFELPFLPVSYSDLSNYAFPKVIDRFLSDLKFI